MTVHDQWKWAYAVQARADLRTRHLLCHSLRTVPACHQHQFLQMACEKLVKACLLDAGRIPPTVHTVVAKQLPRISNEYYRRQNGGNLPRNLAAPSTSLARQIELLAPAVRDASARQDTWEYPWSDPAGTRVFVPAEFEFTNLALLSKPPGRLLLKILPLAIEALASAS